LKVLKMGWNQKEKFVIIEVLYGKG
jgi:hypothetical protein